MGDWFQRIVDRDVALIEAEHLASKIREWLIEQEIIEPQLTYCGLDNDGLGYPPGRKSSQVVVGSSDDSQELEINGLQIIVGRTVFDCGQGGFDLICHQCRSRIDVNEISKVWGDAVTEWYRETGQGLLKCPSCGYVEPVTEWQYDPSFGFGNLGFEFWNWDTLTASFIEDLSKQLGHRTVYVSGKL
jgi:hypothetical protein